MRAICEYCGSNEVMNVKKDTKVIEIIKHKNDCSYLKKLLEGSKEV